MTSVRQLCKNCCWLENGHTREIGLTDKVVDNYLADASNRITDLFIPERSPYRNTRPYHIKIKDFKILNSNLKTGDDITMEMVVENNSDKEVWIDVAVAFYTKTNSSLFQFFTKDTNSKLKLGKGLNAISIQKERFPLHEGEYWLNLWVGDGNIAYDHITECFLLSVNGGINQYGENYEYRGIPVLMNATWSVRQYQCLQA